MQRKRTVNLSIFGTLICRIQSVTHAEYMNGGALVAVIFYGMTVSSQLLATRETFAI
jgi:hypothetical protein